MKQKPRKTKPVLLEGLFPYRKGNLAKDLFAGVSLAAVAIPVDMGYAKIAQMPIVTGLYALLLPCVAFAVFGASRRLVVGADSASAAILAAGVTALASPGTPEYASYASMLALMVGVLLLICRVFRLGFIAQFLSRTVLAGFLTGIGIQVALGQLPELFGISASGNTFQKLEEMFANLGNVNFYAAGVAALAFLVILLPKLFYKKFPVLKKIPWALIAIGLCIGLGYALGDILPLTGSVPGGLPVFSLPAFSAGAFTALLGSAISITVIVITQSAATASAFAEKHNESAHTNRDLLGLGMANIAAGVSGSFPVNGSPTKTEVADGAGANSQAANLTAAGVVLLVLLFFTAPLGFLPGAALAAIVFVTGAGLVDIATMKKVFRVRRDEFFLALATAAAVVLFGAAWGILLAIVLSLLDHIHHSYKPENTVFHHEKNDPEDISAWKPVSPGVYAVPGVVVYHFAASLYYANTSLLQKEITLLAKAPQTEEIVIDFSAIPDVDYTGGEALKDIYRNLHAKKIRLSFLLVRPKVREELDKYGITPLVGKENVYPSIRSILDKLNSENLSGIPAN